MLLAMKQQNRIWCSDNSTFQWIQSLAINAAYDDVSEQNWSTFQKIIIAARAENIGGANKNVDKFFTEELKQIADRDPLHDLTIQVRPFYAAVQLIT